MEFRFDKTNLSTANCVKLHTIQKPLLFIYLIQEKNCHNKFVTYYMSIIIRLGSALVYLAHICLVIKRH
jgi:hypothetical protein